MKEAKPPGPHRLGHTEADTLDGGPNAPGPLSPGVSRSPSSGSLDGGRFTPGTIVDARYRVVGLLGRGGMGEVYRAEDLRLGEAVALKFLPEKLVRDGAALARFHREVRTARLITHRNVVRVHDLGEIGGQPFVSMEYVDGEDLASLLRRIGRLPEGKAVELACQLCAGLAAAHERGIIHRDLKPGNVLVDGQGRAKISDFGLAALASDLQEPELAGTPAYMAPEQLGEGRVSFASDIYSLGLVLFEMFSGRRPFGGDERREILERLHQSDPPRLSTHVQGLDRRIEEVVLHCLRPEPERRPQSALDVMAALPGGDPLAAALAAGETPSPEMVARAREAGTLRRPVALALLGLFAAGTAAFLIASSGMSAVSLAAPLPPQVLVHQARAVLAQAGFEGAHHAWDYEYTELGVHELSEKRLDLAAWRALAAERPGFMELWYREADRPLTAGRRLFWRVTPEDPPPQTPGSATVTLDGQGRLRRLLVSPALDAGAAAKGSGASAARESLPPSAAAPRPSAADPDWAPFFAAAELPMDALTPVTPDRAPPIHGDRVEAWTGTYPGQKEPRITVEATARGGQVVFWQVREDVAGPPLPPPTLPAIAFVAFAVMWIGAGVLARRHLRSGSGDRAGALRLGAVVAWATFIGPLLLAHHSTVPSYEFPIVFSALAQGTMFGAITWLLYMALEPYARRVAPRWVVSWTRLLEGRVKDPMVGRDLLCGLACAATAYGTIELAFRIAGARGAAALDSSYPHGFASLRGVLPTLANVLHPTTLLVPFGIMFILVLTRALLRRPWPAIVAAAALVCGFDLLLNGFHVSGMMLALMLIGVGARWGLLALVAAAFFTVNLAVVPATADPALWWSSVSWLGWGAVVLLALYAFRIAIASRPPS